MTLNNNNLTTEQIHGRPSKEALMETTNAVADYLKRKDVQENLTRFHFTSAPEQTCILVVPDDRLALTAMLVVRNEAIVFINEEAGIYKNQGLLDLTGDELPELYKQIAEQDLQFVPSPSIHEQWCTVTVGGIQYRATMNYNLNTTQIMQRLDDEQNRMLATS